MFYNKNISLKLATINKRFLGKVGVLHHVYFYLPCKYLTFSYPKIKLQKNIFLKIKTFSDTPFI